MYGYSHGEDILAWCPHSKDWLPLTWKEVRFTVLMNHKRHKYWSERMQTVYDLLMAGF